MTSGVVASDRPASDGRLHVDAARQSPLELVARVAGQLGGDLEFHQILGEIAHSSRTLLDIDRVSIFTLDGDYLRPAVSASRVADDHLWATFRTMPPVSLDLSSEARVLLARGRAVEIDARVSPVVPAEWLRTFALTYLALVPLRVANTVRGVLIADSSDPSRARLTPEQLQALETVASLAGLLLDRHEHAVANLRQTADLLAVTRSLAEADSLGEIASAAAAGLRAVLSAGSAGVALLDDGAVAATGTAGPVVESESWAQLAERCASEPAESGQVLIDDGEVLVLARLIAGEVVVAARLEGAAAGDSGERQRAFLVLDQIHHAVRRYRSQAAESEARQRLGDITALAAAATAHGPLADLVDRLAQPLRMVAGADLLDLFIHPATRARAHGLRGPTPTEARRVGAWRRSLAAPKAIVADRRGLVPIVSGTSVLGALIVRVSPSTSIETLQQFGALLGPVIEAAILRRELDDQRRRNEELEERLRLEGTSRVAALERLDTASALTRGGRVPGGRNGMPRADELSRVHEMVREATQELAVAHNVSAAAWTVRRGLVGKMRALARGASRPGFAVVVRATAGVGDIEPANSTSLVLATHDILRLAAVTRASQVVIRITRDGASLVVEIRADGRLALADGLGGTASHVLLRTLQRQLEPVGVRIELNNGGTSFVVRLRTAQTATHEG